jgi:hypothetical protein
MTSPSRLVVKTFKLGADVVGAAPVALEMLKKDND